LLGIRPEDVQDVLFSETPAARPTIEVPVEVAEPMGAETLLYVDTGAHSLIARVRPTDHYDAGAQVRLALDLDKVHLFDIKTEHSLN